MMGWDRETGWLREGYPILPRFLRQAWGDELVPSAVQQALGLPPTHLRDLDASVWGRLTETSRVAVLASYLRALTTSRLYVSRTNDAGAARSLPIIGSALPDGIALGDLPFRHRTRTILMSAGRLNDLAWASSVAASDFLGLRNAGVVSLLDFAVVLEAHTTQTNLAAAGQSPVAVEAAAPMESKGSQEREMVLAQLEELIQRLRGQYNLENVSSHDPRLPLFHRRNHRLPVGVRGATVNEVLDNLVGAATAATLSEARVAVAVVQALSETFGRLEHQSLDVALTELAAAATAPKNVPILTRRLGWDGSGGATLEATARGAGISRERVRQVEGEALGKLRGCLYCPPLDKAISVLDQAAHRLELDGPSALREHGIADAEFLPAGVLTAAEALGRTAHFSVGRDGRAVFGLGEKEGESLRAAANSLADLFFIASVYELQARVQEREGHDVPLAIIRRFLARLDGLTWLDPEENWFWLSSRGSSIVTTTRKILSVSRRLSLETLRDGVLRPLRTRGAVIPRSVYAGLCKAIGCTVEEKWVLAPQELESPEILLPRAERLLVETLRASENVMGLLELREESLRRGMNHFTCNVFTSYSPLLERVAPGIYALRGAEIDPARVAFLLRSAPARQVSLLDHGWTDGGALWIGYRATPGLVNGGVIGFPSPVARLVGDRQFELRTEDGGKVGTLSVRNGMAWGFSAFIRRRGVEAGDYVVILVDMAQGISVVRAGALELLQSYQDGDGEGPGQLFGPDSRRIREIEGVEAEAVT